MKLEGSLQNSNSQSTIPILTQTDPAQTLPFHAFMAHVHGQILHFSLPRCHLSSGIPTKALLALFSFPMRAAFPAHSCSFIRTPQWNIARSTDHSTLLGAIFPSLLLLPPSYDQNILLNTPFSNDPSTWSSLNARDQMSQP